MKQLQLSEKEIMMSQIVNDINECFKHAESNSLIMHYLCQLFLSITSLKDSFIQDRFNDYHCTDFLHDLNELRGLPESK